MSDNELSYAEALNAADRNEVEAIDAREATALDEIGSFANLKSLDLSGNGQITKFDFLDQLPNLEKLYLSDMGLAKAPDQIRRLKRLTTLLIGKNAIKDFSFLTELPALVDLGIEQMGLRKLPAEVLAISQLKILGLFDNDIGTIAPLKKLPRLESLYVAHNKLKKIPAELKKLQHLKKLDIAFNYTLKDWSVVEQLEQLEELRMSNAHDIELLPEGIFRLPNLRSLYVAVHWNAPPDQLKGIGGIGALTQLEQLEIHGSSISALPDSLSELSNLRKLDLKDNGKLIDISALRDLPKLEQLNLTKCAVKVVPASFSTLKSLRTFEFSHNEGLEDISGLRDLPALEELTLYTKLPALPKTLGSLTSLRTLNISGSTNDVSFLEPLLALERLYIGECTFDALPETLTALRELNIFQQDKDSDDSYLSAYKNLEQLKLRQASFTLPVLPKLRLLEVARISKTLDLTSLAQMPALETLSLSRSETIAPLPTDIAQAAGLKQLTIEFMKAVESLSPLQDMPGLEQLSVRYCDRLQALPEELATLTGLRSVILYNLKAVDDISVLAKLPELSSLELERLPLAALPEGIGDLSNLKHVKLKDLKVLTDISPLERSTSLQSFVSDDCRKLSRKAIAKITNAIAERTASGAAPLKTSYATFIESGAYKQLEGKEDANQTYDFPLWFDRPETLLEAVEHYSWLDDYRRDAGELGSILTDPDSALKPVAICDLGFEGCDTDMIDAYSEEIFLVDTVNKRNPVLIWGHDGPPTQIHADFDDFLACLRDFRVDEDQIDEHQVDTDHQGSAEQRTYLEYVDEKSSKFWQIVVTGTQHEVTYGKIGKPGSSKVKSFDDEAACQKDAARLVQTKLKKGYVEK